MRPELLSSLVCPRCAGTVQLRDEERLDDGQIWQGYLACACGEDAAIREGIPRFAPSVSLESSVAQVRESFSFKWGRLPTFGLGGTELTEFYDRWFCQKVGRSDMDEFRTFLSGKRRFLDAGTGLGAKVDTFCRFNPHAMAVGVDFSDSVGPAFANTRRWPNAHIVQADLMRLPFPRECFDLIVCDGVLHHTRDAEKAFHGLVPHLTGGGEIAVHVYKRLGPIREFCDDLLRRHAVTLSPDACWEFSVPFTKFGEALAALNAVVEVPEDLPLLGIQAGRYDLQRFVYYHVLKCFWNPEFTFEENNLVNFDWYHPAIASHHTEEEVTGWFKDAGLTDLRMTVTHPNGISVMGRRPPG